MTHRHGGTARSCCSFLCALLLLVLAPCAAQAQFRLPADLAGPQSGSFAAPGGDLVTVQAQLVAAEGTRPAAVVITATIAPDYHIYAVDQTKDASGGGPEPTRIRLEESPDFRLAGDFGATPAPDTHIDELVWIGLEIREHKGRVTWFAPLEISPHVDIKRLSIQGSIQALACNATNCVPVRTPSFAAKVGPPPAEVPLDQLTKTSRPAPPVEFEGPTTVGFHQVPSSNVRWTGELQPARVPPGGTALLSVTATPQPGWLIYALADRPEGLGPKPTLIQVENASGLVVGQPSTSATVSEKDDGGIFGVIRYHGEPVTWRTPVKVPADAREGVYTISGALGGMVCENSVDGGMCESPQGARFMVRLDVNGVSPSGGSTPVTFAPASYTVAAALAGQAAPATAAPQTTTTPSISSTLPSTASLPAVVGGYDLAKIELGPAKGSLFYYLLTGFLGGIILNVMPCVLPVIGLKLMSFVEQAGQSRTKALLLNIWYSIGIVSVFLALAWLAVSANLAWGEQFGSPAFNVTLAAIVFAMALSLLGVWEFPIPGFLGHGTAGEMADQEGPLGAFLKGVITTILATPCTGPLMATGIAWAVTQPTSTTFAVFFAVGIGMASPYLLVGAFPSLIRFLPKPGMWMVTFKQVMGFVLLATVVFLLSFLPIAMVIPTLALLVGIAMACWWISRTPLTAGFGKLLHAWTVAALWIAICSMFSFGILEKRFADRDGIRSERIARAKTGEVVSGIVGRLTDVRDTQQLEQIVGELERSLADDGEQPWQNFTLAGLRRFAVDDGRTVLVDFSAEWCVTCKVLEATVLHTDEVESAIQQAGVVTMYADFTHRPAKIEEMLGALGSNGVPVIAIFPGNDPYRPIVFRGPYTKDALLAAIARATGAPPEGGGTFETTAAHRADGAQL